MNVGPTPSSTSNVPVWFMALVVIAGLSLVACATSPSPPDDAPTPTAEYRYGDEEELSDGRRTFIVGTVGSVTIPGIETGTTTVAFAEADQFIDADVAVPTLSGVIAVRMKGDLALRTEDAGALPTMVLTLRESATSSSARPLSSSTPMTSMTVVRVRPITQTNDEAWTDLAGEAAYDPIAGTYETLVHDPGSICNSLITGTTAKSAAGCDFTAQVIELREWFDEVRDNFLHGAIDMRVGLHKLDIRGFVSGGADCEAPRPWPWLTHDSESATWQREHRSAVVFVHGWQTLAGLLKLKPGDTRALAPHCTNWEQFLTSIGSAAGPWAEINRNADIYLFRYDSDKRVAYNANILADWFAGLRSHGYERIVLVGHSMGGLVIHHARQIDRDRGASPDPTDSRVITLATPYMGGPLLCQRWNHDVCLSTKSALVPLIDGITVLGLDGTLDLSTALAISSSRLNDMGHRGQYQENPYLLNLWHRIDLSDPTIVAYVGSSSINPFVVENAPYGTTHHLMSPGWGANDGIVPVASGVAATSLADAPPVGRLEHVHFYGRDHTGMVQGCATDARCPVSGLVGDPYLDHVAGTIASSLVVRYELTFTPGLLSGLAPPNGTVTRTLELENSGTGNISVNSIGSHARWVNASPSSIARLEPGDTAAVTVTMDATGLVSGEHAAEVFVAWGASSASHVARTDTIPVRLTVTEPPPPNDTLSGGIAFLPSGNWRATLLYPSLLSTSTTFQQIGGSAPIAPNGSFSLDLTPITPPPVLLIIPTMPPGVTLDPTNTAGGTFSLIAFDDTNGNQQLDPGEPFYEINDPTNTFGVNDINALILEYTTNPHTITGSSQTTTGLPVTWNVDAAGGWNRKIYRSTANGTAVEVTANHQLTNLPLNHGRSGTIGTTGLTSLTSPTQQPPPGLFVPQE